MQSPLDPTLISNWTVALIQGVAAALRSAEQGGIVGELPFSDLILALDRRRVRSGQKGSNVFYGRDTHWAQMVLRSFQSRQLDFSYVLFDGKTHSNCEHGHRCLMAFNPIQKPKENQPQKHLHESSHRAGNGHTAPGTATDHCVVNIPDAPSGAVNRDAAQNTSTNRSKPSSFNPPGGAEDLLPGMLYGLFTSSVGESGSPKLILHKEECIRKRVINMPPMKDISDLLRGRLSGTRPDQALSFCHRLIGAMCDLVKKHSSAEEDAVFISNLIHLMDRADNPPQDEAELWTSIITSFSDRVPEMLERLGIKSIDIAIKNLHQKYPIEDIPVAFFIFFGIHRAFIMSKHVYNEKEPALIFTAKDISTGLDVLRDLTEIPSLVPKSGFGSSLATDKTGKTYKRILEMNNESANFFRLVFLLEAATAVAIMLLTFIGPILSMYSARQWASSYRESCMQKGTSMRWAVDKVALYAGKTHDDFTVCIVPKKHRRLSTLLFIFLTFFTSVVCIVLWPISHPRIAFPFTDFSRKICLASCTIGVLWVILPQRVFRKSELKDMYVGESSKSERADSKQSASSEPKGAYVEEVFKSGRVDSKQSASPEPKDASERTDSKQSASGDVRNYIHLTINILLVALLLILVETDIEKDWLYLYVLEAVYGLQWLYGELMDEWVFESTSFFMLGALSALRLATLVDV